MRSVYPSKVLVVGEYTVLINGDALAIPYGYYSGSWRAGVHAEYPFDFNRWTEHLASFNQKHIKIDVNRIHLDYERGVRFVSNIPSGGGLGSSGAVTAAFFDRYMHMDDIHQKGIGYIRSFLADVEGFFHGVSSGVDPLVSYSDKSYRSLNDEVTMMEPFIAESIPLHLIHTSKNRQTAPLVNQFRSWMDNNKAFHEMIHQSLIPTIQDFISAWSSHRIAVLEDCFKVISRLQWEHFKPMIVDEIRPLWELGLQEDTFNIKLCGAGGGGAYLAMGDLPEDHGFKTNRIR